MNLQQRTHLKLNEIVVASYNLSRKYRKFLTKDIDASKKGTYLQIADDYLDFASDLSKIIISLGGKPQRGHDAYTELVYIWQQLSELFFDFEFNTLEAECEELEKYIWEKINQAIGSTYVPIHAKIFLNKYLSSLKTSQNTSSQKAIPSVQENKIPA